MINKTIKSKDFSNGNIIYQMIKLAVPMTLAQLINVLYNIVDRIFIGKIPNNATESLIGLGICFPIITIVIAFANFIGMGGAPLFSIERGKGNRKEAEYILGNSFILLIFIGIFLTISIFIFKRPLLYFLGAGENTYIYADSYMSYYLIGTIFVTISLGLNSFINAQGFGNVGMITVLIGAVINIILDPIFIFKFKLGVEGAAIATVIAQFLSAVWTFSFLIGKRTEYKIKISKMRLSLKRIRRILFLGFAGFIMNVTNSCVQMSCNINLKIYGGDIYIGAMTVINSIREVISMPVCGLTNSAQPILGYNYGAKKYKRVKECIKYMSSALIVYTLIAWIIVFVFPSELISIFNSDVDLLKAGVPSMHIYFFGFCMMALQFSGQTVFSSLGKSGRAIFFSIFRKIIIVVPLIFILPRIGNLRIVGVFLAEPISNFIGGIACFTTMILTIYKKL
ncbi:MATE family efflux transporter [Clostridium sp. BJN0001]|uniref:MATE family efflux transporter n=1 Tax=Clostridium sp. BJN0001 TaxID=2930219 RepID=UPI001FD5972F|nr:MATE family efflux transporter [Clostridium sp. BJN0001]